MKDLFKSIIQNYVLYNHILNKIIYVMFSFVMNGLHTLRCLWNVGENFIYNNILTI